MYFEVDEIKKEVTDHLTEGLPVAIYQRSLKKAQQDQLMPHWHAPGRGAQRNVVSSGHPQVPTKDL